MRLAAGELRHLIELQENCGSTQDATGKVQPEWKTQFKARAKIEQIGGSEDEVYQQLVPSASFKISTHYTCAYDITPEWRIVHNKKVYQIVAVDNVGGLNETFEFFCNA